MIPALLAHHELTSPQTLSLFLAAWSVVAVSAVSIVVALKLRLARWVTRLLSDPDPCHDGTCQSCFDHRFDAEVDWPWCEACRSWHHPANPTCRNRKEVR